MRPFLFLLAALSVVIAFRIPLTTPNTHHKNKLVARVRDGPGGGSASRPHPRPVGAFRLGKGNPAVEKPVVVEDFHQFVNTEPRFKYPKRPFATKQTDADPARAGGGTVFGEGFDGARFMGRLELGREDETWREALTLAEQLYPELRGREYTPLSSAATDRDLQRTQSLIDFKETMVLNGQESKTPPDWAVKKAYYKDLAVKYKASEAARQKYQMGIVTRSLETWLRSAPDGERVRVVESKTVDELVKTPYRNVLPEWYQISQQAPSLRKPDGRGTPWVVPYPVTPELGEEATLYDRIIDPEDNLPGASVRFAGQKYNAEEYQKPKLSKRQNPVSTITSQEAGAIAGVTNNSEDLSADFEQYLLAYELAQANVSDLIFPFLDTMLNGTNCSIIYNAAWSIYSDLTGTSPMIIGPFFYGMHSLDWIEDQLFGNSTNTTVTNNTKMEILAVHSILLDLYKSAWSNATAAINATGLLDDMFTLSKYLSTNDTSIMPPGYANYTAPSYNDSYFTIYNETGMPDGT